MDFCEESTSVGLPRPDGTIDTGDRSHLLWLYRGIPLEETQKYSNLNDLYCLFGISNIRTWADLSGDKNPADINQRIAQMTTLADNYINSRLLDGPYQIPFEKPTNKTIVDLSARLTGTMLYDDRGVTDSDSEKHELIYHKEIVERYISWILSRKMRLDRATVIESIYLPDFGAGRTYIKSGYLGTVSTAVYCSRSDIEKIFGTENVIKWSDLDNDRDSSKIESRIDCIIDKATMEIECRLRDGPYKVPFIAPYDKLIIDTTARLVGVMLYECRGVQDSNNDNHELEWHRRQVETVINGIMSRKYRLTSTVVIPAQYTPVFV